MKFGAGVGKGSDHGLQQQSSTAGREMKGVLGAEAAKHSGAPRTLCATCLGRRGSCCSSQRSGRSVRVNTGVARTATIGEWALACLIIVGESYLPLFSGMLHLRKQTQSARLLLQTQKGWQQRTWRTNRLNATAYHEAVVAGTTGDVLDNGSETPTAQISCQSRVGHESVLCG